MPHNIPCIPFNVIEKLLLSLDVKTLIKCSFVCRHWNSLITTPDFIFRYSNQTFHSKNEVLLLQICRTEVDSVSNRELNCREIYSLRSDNDLIDLLRAVKSPPIDRFKKKTSFFEVVGTSNGLVCLVDNRLRCYTFILWNPTVRKYVLLPRRFTTFEEKASIGFGFDRRNNDFKVVKLVNDKEKLDMPWVCSLATRSWKSLTETPPPCFVPEDESNVFINGVLHWVAEHNVRHYNFVLTLDLAEEAFGEILLPQSISIEGPTMTSISLVARGDSLALSQVEQRVEVVSLIWCVWVMKEYGVPKSWTKKVTMQELIPKNVLAIRKNGDMILEMERGQILRYNPTTATSDDLGIRGDSVFIGYHAEGLCLLERREDVRSYT